MVTTPQKLTASETVLLAAADLTAAGSQEFSEWDLTVAAWNLDKHRFGLRGYALSHPDHKRVMMEIMGKKASSPVQQKYLEKTRPNYYRLTPLGKAIAADLRSDPRTPGPATPAAGKPAAKPLPATVSRSPATELYEKAALYVGKAEFRRWLDNPEEPREWAGAARFLGLNGTDISVNPIERLEEVRAAIQAAFDWCKAHDTVYLTRGGNASSPIPFTDLANALDFLQALTYRFPEALDPKKGGGGGKHKKRF
jgi:hypothetical protein